MTRLTSFVLRHRLLVVAFWVLLAGLGGATITTTAGRLTQSFAQSNSPAQRTAERMAQVYHTDDGVEPDVVVATLPAGRTVDSPGVGDQLSRAFATARQLGARVVDYATTGDRAFVTADGRTTYALIFLPPGASFGPELAARVTQAVQAAAPPGASVRVTGLGPLQFASGQPQGNGVLAETVIGGLG